MREAIVLAIFIAKRVSTATVSVPQEKSPPRISPCLWAPLPVTQWRWPYNETLKQIAAYSFDRVIESQTSTANHRRETVHLALDQISDLILEKGNYRSESRQQSGLFRDGRSGSKAFRRGKDS